ncbi:restriction endonuclease subunit S [Vibrio cholerae]|uniref:restriction endonuclease subunit S n=1 Tax=Vibrio cholerae TaxID=666 RepID=UPI0015618171|nr:restriction endonuclease subunit S [Vibrio cholerae]NOF86779.1 restriction endonuclease subunit S [Vibrio cholerae]NOF96639.1 restriction endonuclease subunit S [Vibrio cholerae]
MSCNWSVKKLGDLVKFTSGGTPSKSNEAYWGGDIPWISASSMDSTRYSESELKVTTEGAKNGTRLVPKDTVLLLVRGGALHNKIPVGITTREVTFNQDVKALVPKTDEITPWYLLFWLISIKKTLLAKVENTGIGAGKLDTKILQELEVPLPPKPELQRLEKFCKALDDKIILNADTNQTLEQMAQAIFKSWFVDFDPVKAKMNGEQPEGMDAATASLFPEKLVESELGLIPEGWEVLPSEKVATVAIGKTPPRKEPKWFSEDSKDVTWISIRDMGNTGTYALDSSEYLTQEAVDKFNVKVIPDNTLILSFKLTVGRVAITHGEMTTNEAIAHYKLSDNARVSTNYLYSYMKQFNFESLGSTSSIAKAVNSKIIKALPVIVPSKEILDSFDTLVKPLFDKIKSNQMENQNLEALRDTLLPKLLSGDIELSAEL